MIKLNDDSIFVGQIKQVLHNFNLPRCQSSDKIVKKIITQDETYYYSVSKLIRDNYFIDKNTLYYNEIDLSTGSLVSTKVDNYVENSKYLNLTTTLEINSKYYDEYTHKYLGDYLRFLRDYHNLNLMSMYNCNYNKIANHNLIFTGDNNTITWDIDSNNIYLVPISCFENYTIALKGNAEISLCLYDIENDKKITFIDNDINIGDNFFFNNVKSIYCEDITDSIFLDLSILKNKWTILLESQYIKNLTLLIKVPKDYNSEIVVLEGNYTKKGQIQLNLNNDSWKDLDLISYICRPQLLTYENNNNYLLADKLIEYLTGNAITSVSESYDIEKVQNWLKDNKINLLDKQIQNKDYPININLLNTYKGIWSKEMTYSLVQLYYYYLNNPKYNNEPWYDFTGYVDSNMEELFEKEGVENPEYEYGGIV